MTMHAFTKQFSGLSIQNVTSSTKCNSSAIKTAFNATTLLSRQNTTTICHSINVNSIQPFSTSLFTFAQANNNPPSVRFSSQLPSTSELPLSSSSLSPPPLASSTLKKTRNYNYWTNAEFNKLCQLAKQHSQWQKIALEFPDRKPDNVQNKLYRSKLYTKVGKERKKIEPWSTEQIGLLQDLVHQYGNHQWSTISNLITDGGKLPIRASTHCQEKWLALNPQLNRYHWRLDELERFLKAMEDVKEIPSSSSSSSSKDRGWGLIADGVGTRTPRQCQNKWGEIVQKILSTTATTTTTTTTTLNSPSALNNPFRSQALKMIKDVVTGNGGRHSWRVGDIELLRPLMTRLEFPRPTNGRLNFGKYEVPKELLERKRYVNINRMMRSLWVQASLVKEKVNQELTMDQFLDKVVEVKVKKGLEGFSPLKKKKWMRKGQAKSG